MGSTKKPTLFDRAKAAQPKDRATSTTARLDDQKVRLMSDAAAARVKKTPNDMGANRALLAAIAMDEAFTAFRAAIVLLGDDSRIPNAARRRDELRTLKETAGEDIEADATRVHSSVKKLLKVAESVIDDGKRLRLK